MSNVEIRYNEIFKNRSKALYIVQTEISADYFYPPYNIPQTMYWTVQRRGRTFRHDYREYFKEPFDHPDVNDIETDFYQKRLINGMFNEMELAIMVNSLSKLESATNIIIHKFNCPLTNFNDPTVKNGRTLFDNSVYVTEVFNLSVIIPHEDIIQMFDDDKININGLIYCQKNE